MEILIFLPFMLTVINILLDIKIIDRIRIFFNIRFLKNKYIKGKLADNLRLRSYRQIIPLSDDLEVYYDIITKTTFCKVSDNEYMIVDDCSNRQEINKLEALCILNNYSSASLVKKYIS